MFKKVIQVKKRKNCDDEEFIMVIRLIAFSYTSIAVEGLLNEVIQIDENVPFGNVMLSPS